MSTIDDKKDNSSKCVVKWDIDVNTAEQLCHELGTHLLATTQTKSNSINGLASDKRLNNIVKDGVKSGVKSVSLNSKALLSNSEYGIDILSDELLVDIFKHLSIKSLHNCSQVSKKWSRIAFDSSLWKCIDLTKQHINSRQLENILKRGVVSIRLFSTTIFDNKLDFHFLHSIQNLDLSLANISVDTLNLLLRCNESDISLKKLSIESLTINQKTLELIVSKHKQLEVLNMSMCHTSLSDKQLSFIDKLSEALIELNASWIPELNVDEIINLLPNSLRRINISGYRTALLDEHIHLLVTRCPRLQELDICDSIQITDFSLRCICENLTKLEALHISRCMLLTDLNLINCIISLKNLSIHDLNLNPDIYSTQIIINKSFISTIARPNANANDQYSSIWGINLRK